MEQDAVTRSAGRADVGLACVAAGALAFACIGPEGAVLLGIFAVPAAVVALVWRLRDRRERPRGVRWAGYVAALLLALTGPLAWRVMQLRVVLALTPVIDGIERHRERTGRYPEDVPGRVCPYMPPVSYFLRDDGSYVVGCMTFALTEHQYDSRTNEWADLDH